MPTITESIEPTDCQTGTVVAARLGYRALERAISYLREQGYEVRPNE